MLTTGTLLRISNDDFLRLIRAPLVREVSAQAAATLIADGGRWIDLRDADQFAAGSQPDAMNVPISLLRLKRRALPNDVTYLLYADNRRTEELGCYLLAECGLSACMLDTPLTGYAAPALSVALADDPPIGEVSLSATQEIRINAVPEPPPSLFDVGEQVDVHELLAVERRRYEKLLTERTRIIKETVERQANAMLAKKDAEMREQVLAKMRVLREERDRLLAHAKVLEAERLALAQERAAFTAEQLTAGRILQEA